MVLKLLILTTVIAAKVAEINDFYHFWLSKLSLFAQMTTLQLPLANIQSESVITLVYQALVMHDILNLTAALRPLPSYDH